MAEYPKRDAYFAHHTVRLMFKVCAAQEIDSEAMLLVIAILHQEDAKRYRGPITFYNGQLAPILGFTSWSRLDRARKAAIKAGWLHYESGGKRKPGLYWGMIPEHLKNVDDMPIDEGYPSVSIVESGGASGVQVEGQAGRKRGASGEPPILSPKPKPKPKEDKRAPEKLKFVIPTLKQVAAYCRERNNTIDAVHFMDHYKSNGWKVGKNSMKDWKAAVRTWEKNCNLFDGVRGQGDLTSGTAEWKRKRQEIESNESG